MFIKQVEKQKATFLGFWFSSAAHVPSRDILYADDTLATEAGEAILQTFLQKIVEQGDKYGLSLNWDKTVVLPVKHEGCLYKDDGQVVRKVESAVYLGGLLTSDGNPACEPGQIKEAGDLQGLCDPKAVVWAGDGVAV